LYTKIYKYGNERVTVVNKKKKFILLFAIIVLSITIFLFVYNSNSSDDSKSKIAVKNGLSVNYVDGDELTVNHKSNVYRFSVTNDSSQEKYYQVNVESLKLNNGLKYSLYSEEAKIEKEDESLDDNILVDYAVINPGDTHFYTLTISKDIRSDVIGKLSVENYIFEQEYFSQTIISNSTVSLKPKTYVGTEISQTDEGLIQDIDDDGVTYYFRGNVTNNYFRFANLMWRIVRINGNNTVRVVLDNQTNEFVPYYLTSDTQSYYLYHSSNLKIYLDNWYENNLKNYDKYINNSKVCDHSTYTGLEEYIFQSSQRLTVNQDPTFNCIGNKYNARISSLSADEIEYAGGMIGLTNTNYYLYNPSITQSTWTISPSKGNKQEFYPYALSANGSIEDNLVGSQSREVRPVIDIVKNVSVDGKGTKDEPYEILY